MDIHFLNDENAYHPEAETVAYLEEMAKSHGIRYALNTYVDRNYWTDSIRGVFEGCSVENMTDYNYSRCFDYWINFISEDFPMTSLKMREYLAEKGELYGLVLKISILGGYLFVRFYQCQLHEGVFVQTYKPHPFLPEHERYAISIGQLCESGQLKMLPEEVLRHILPGVRLELTEEGVSIFNYLFEDSSSPFPY